MGADYIPEKDSKAAVWMKWFARAMVNNPAGYRISVEDAEQVETLAQTFADELKLAEAPITRSPVQVMQKNDARKAAEAMIRPNAQRIRTDPQIERILKFRIGLHSRQKRRRHVEAPGTSPVLQLAAQMSGMIKIRARDSESLKRAKPKAAIGLELFERIRPLEQTSEFLKTTSSGQEELRLPESENQPERPWRFVGVFTRTPFMVPPASAKTGDEVSYVARWMTRRGEVGPFGQIATTTAIHNNARGLSQGINSPQRIAA